MLLARIVRRKNSKGEMIMGTNEGTFNPYIVIHRKLGRGTGDVLYQTVDGRWWKEWRGEQVGTGEEVKQLQLNNG